MAAQQRSLCIVGGGATGMISCYLAKHLFQQHFSRIVVLERSSSLGGLWKYDGVSPMYRDLRTNLPARLMELPGVSFRATGSFDDNKDTDSIWSGARPANDSSPSVSSFSGRFGTKVRIEQTSPEIVGHGQGAVQDFPHHSSVLRYLEQFIDHFDLQSHVTFGADVVNIARKDAHRFRVTWKTQNSVEAVDDVFDTVMNCAGRFAIPHLPTVLQNFGQSNAKITRVHHSKTFDNSAEFAGKYVIVVGHGSSGRDIISLLGPVAKAVIWVQKSRIKGKYCNSERIVSDFQLNERRLRQHNVQLCESVDEAVRCIGNLTGTDVEVHLICATGYQYNFDHLHEDLRPQFFPDGTRSATTLRYADFVPESGYARLKACPGLGFVGLLPVAVPLGSAYYQAKFFLEEILVRGRSDTCPKEDNTGSSGRDLVEVSARFHGSLDALKSIAPAVSRTSHATPDLQQGQEICFHHLLPHALSGDDREDIRWRSDMFDFCEDRILENFTTYRNWEYVVRRIRPTQREQ